MVSTVYRTTTTTNEGGQTKTTTTTSPNNPATHAPVSSGPSASHNTTRVSPFPFQSGNISGPSNYTNVYSTPKDYAQSAYANVPINRSDLQAPITEQLQRQQQAQQAQNQSDATKTSSGGKLSSEFGLSRSEYMRRHAGDVEQKPVAGYEITTKDSAGNVVSGFSISKAEYDKNPEKYSQGNNFPMGMRQTQTGAVTPTTTSTGQLLREQASISGEGFQKSVEGGMQFGALLGGPLAILPGAVGGGLFYGIEKAYANIASPLYDATKININPRLDLATRYVLTPQTVNIEPLNMHLNIFPGRTGEGIGYGGTPGGGQPRSDTSGNPIHEGISFSEVVGFVGASKLTTDITRTVKVGEVRVPAEEGGNTLLYRGLSLERGPTAQPIVGFSGGKMVFGTPKIDIDMAGFRGYTPVTPLETKIVRENIKIPQDEFIMQSKALEVMKVTERTPSAFVQESFSRQTKSLSPTGVDTALKYFKGDKSVEELYGSFADVPQMPKAGLAAKLGIPERVPADIDVKYNLGGEATALKAQGLVSKLRAVGEDVKISDQSPTLIESRNPLTGEYRHAIDFHSKDISPAELSSQSGGEGAFGFRYGQKPIPIEDIPTMPLSEQGLRKGASSVSLWNPKTFKEAQKSYFERIGSKDIPQEKYVSPEPHRMKDIGDFYSREKTLLESRKIGGKDITKPTEALEIFKKKAGLKTENIPSTVKISLMDAGTSYRSPLSLSKPPSKPYFTSLGSFKYQPVSPTISASPYPIKPSLSPSIRASQYQSPSPSRSSITPASSSVASKTSTGISDRMQNPLTTSISSKSTSKSSTSTSISPIYGEYPYYPGKPPVDENSGGGGPPLGGGVGGGGLGGDYWRKPTRTKRIKRPIRDAASYLGLNIMGRKRK
jgi:hypothetical protein